MKTKKECKDHIWERATLINADIRVTHQMKMNLIDENDLDYRIREFNLLIHYHGIKENYTFQPDRKRWVKLK